MGLISVYPNRRWMVASAAPEATAARLREALGCSRLAALLLANRGIESPEQAQAFLNPGFEQLADPLLLPDAATAVGRLRLALERRERIYVHGDYDGDGVTSTALWARLLEKLGADVRAHVPHRRRDGYDLRSKFVAHARSEGAALILTTDCGVQRYDEVEEAREAGIDVIVTDHHEPGPRLPRAVAVVNPRRANSRYPFAGLAGVGVAYRVGEALVRDLGMPLEGYRRAFGDLAAIGTITDVMALLGENRVIVKHGLEALRDTRKPGLRALMASAGVRLDRALSAHAVGFQLGPRINAVGRLHDARTALALLLTREPGEASRLAAALEEANGQRREEENYILSEAAADADRQCEAGRGCIVVVGSSWHAGVIGIVANRLVDRCCRPAIVIALEEGAEEGRGSARSIRPFDLYDAISECGGLLTEFGGHSHAAGFGIRRSRVAEFADAMNARAAQRLTAEDFVPTVTCDAEVDAAQVTEALAEELQRFEPWGHRNEEPVLVSRGLRVQECRRIGRDQTHLKLRVQDASGRALDAIRWGGAELDRSLRAGMSVDLCYSPQSNAYNGRTSVQLLLRDAPRPAEP
ncbi:MAG: single-stranded-DNA-specific exonuclease RecJ [Chthonomonadales bacterium]|nr:single-stranded-DNA-specific exonuclease RecJ [Chthonomonadales bacterium]